MENTISSSKMDSYMLFNSFNEPIFKNLMKLKDSFKMKVLKSILILFSSFRRPGFATFASILYGVNACFSIMRELISAFLAFLESSVILLCAEHRRRLPSKREFRYITKNASDSEFRSTLVPQI